MSWMLLWSRVSDATERISHTSIGTLSKPKFSNSCRPRAVSQLRAKTTWPKFKQQHRPVLPAVIQHPPASLLSPRPAAIANSGT